MLGYIVCCIGAGVPAWKDKLLRELSVGIQGMKQGTNDKAHTHTDIHTERERERGYRFRQRVRE